MMMLSTKLSQLHRQLQRPAVMGVLNVTPDSFSDGGKFFKLDDALKQVELMVNEGADIIDVGGESVRAGAAASLTPEEELDRVLPVIQAIRRDFDIPLTIDTSQPLVITETAAAGVNMLNDSRSLQVVGALDAVVKSQMSVIMYHMQGQPSTMKFVHQAEKFDGMEKQPDPQYNHVINDIKDFFIERIAMCEAAGIPREKILIDPGFCLGKTYQHNMQLLANLSQFNELNLPVCVGMSRKSFIGRALDQEVSDRLYGTVATSVIAAQQGVAIIRVHDVKPTLDALKIVQAVQQEGALT